MKKNYIQPVCETQVMKSLHVICGSPEAELFSGGPENPNNVEIF